jgi:hypothetical protein
MFGLFRLRLIASRVSDWSAVQNMPEDIRVRTGQEPGVQVHKELLAVILQRGDSEEKPKNGEAAAFVWNKESKLGQGE